MRFVKAEKPVTTKHENHGDLSVEVEVPRLESIEEFTTFAGGADNALEFINNAVETAAKNGGRAALRNIAKDANLDEAKAKVQQVVRDYAPQNAAGKEPSKAKKAETLDEITKLAQSGELTQEKLLEMLKLAK